ncbi:hypothetical protein DSO57_1023486 [Entomophthora muscae]|uniref:Uncharacterized protein n=1 Tax=Entomophthora muscae TaxID=34485 RepID=A0ACC2T3B7_9FUNG|nr:hypothetical protein DSO57_1023486 [Entomophthora muscae]
MLVPTQEKLVNFISSKKIATNLPPPKASDILSELTLPHKLKQLSNGEHFLIHNVSPGFKDCIIFYATQQNLMDLKKASTWQVDGTVGFLVTSPHCVSWVKARDQLEGVVIL